MNPVTEELEKAGEDEHMPPYFPYAFLVDDDADRGRGRFLMSDENALLALDEDWHTALAVVAHPDDLGVRRGERGGQVDVRREDGYVSACYARRGGD